MPNSPNEFPLASFRSLLIEEILLGCPCGNSLLKVFTLMQVLLAPVSYRKSISCPLTFALTLGLVVSPENFDAKMFLNVFIVAQDKAHSDKIMLHIASGVRRRDSVTPFSEKPADFLLEHLKRC